MHEHAAADLVPIVPQATEMTFFFGGEERGEEEEDPLCLFLFLLLSMDFATFLLSTDLYSVWIVMRSGGTIIR